MSRIKAILDTNSMYRVERDVPQPEEISELQEAIGKPLPPSYLEFIELGGLGDLRFSYEVLDPSEISEQRQYVLKHGLVPFASNGCGDLVCWSLQELPGSAAYFWDHETDTHKHMFTSFEEGLESWRF